MALFGLFGKKWKDNDTDFISDAENFEKAGDYAKAIETYEKLILVIYKNASPSKYKHIAKKIINCYLSLGDYEKVIILWPSQFEGEDYGAKEIYELIKVLEAAGKNDLVLRVYESAGSKLTRNKIDFLIKIKKIPQANDELTRLLASVSDNTPGIIELWLMKVRLSMGLLKFEEANRYLGKILEKSPHNEEARKLKDFCRKQMMD